jgi:protein-tyrosine phosphatase
MYDKNDMTSRLSNFIDIHTHILPGLDDGPNDLQGSIAIARCYEKTGIKTVIATPHFLPGTAWAASKEKVLESVQTLQMTLDKENIDLKIEAGMEIAFHKKLEERILSGDLLPLWNSGFFLIEPSFHGEQGGLLTTLASLLQKGQKLILAHPERVDAFQQRPELLERLVGQGLLIQVNTGSLLGYFGEKSRETAVLLSENNCLHFIASDAHNHDKRTPLDEEEWRNLLCCHGGEGALSSCIGNISEIFLQRQQL